MFSLQIVKCTSLAVITYTFTNFKMVYVFCKGIDAGLESNARLAALKIEVVCPQTGCCGGAHYGISPVRCCCDAQLCSGDSVLCCGITVMSCRVFGNAK